MSTARLYHFSRPSCKSEHDILELITFSSNECSRRACAYAQARQSLHCLDMQSMDIDEGSNQYLGISKRQHRRLNDYIAHMR